MTKPLALGNDDFAEIREGNFYYIDKTLMIQDFLRLQAKVTLITRPRRFGKTLNMTMMREFFDRTKKESKKYFSGLKIMETKSAEQMHSRPVIYLTFKNCDGTSLEDLHASLADAILPEYIRYAKIFEPSADKDSSDYFRFFKIYEMLLRSEIKKHLLRNSLVELTRAVHIFYNQKPLLLIDEYDQPLVKAHERGFREEFSVLYGNFLGSALKSNDHLGQALITGIQRVIKESIFSGVNNFLVYTVLDYEYSTYFGLTEGETRDVLRFYDLELTEAVQKYYDGYQFGNTRIYNPWSVLEYILKRKLKPYWLNTSTNALIKEAIQKADNDFYEKFEKLILDEEVRATIGLETAFIELANTKTLWGLLVNAGYLTATEAFKSEAKMLRIPNLEVKSEFREIVSSYMNLGQDRLNDLFNALIDKDMSEFLNIYQKIVYDYVSYHDVKENSYHMLFLGMSIATSGMYKVSSNLEVGKGRADILMESLQPDLRPHIVIEFKQGDNLEQLKEQALEQIFVKKYYTKFSGKILCVGIAHDKKDCEIAYKEIDL